MTTNSVNPSALKLSRSSVSALTAVAFDAVFCKIPILIGPDKKLSQLEMRIFLFLLVTIVLAQQLHWQKEFFPNHEIGTSGYQSVDFPHNAAEIKYDIECGSLCNIYLLEKSAFESFKNNIPHVTLFESLRTLAVNEHYYNERKLANGVVLVIQNSSPEFPVRVSFTMHYLVPNTITTARDLGIYLVVGMIASCLFGLIVTLIISCLLLCGVFGALAFGREKEVNKFLERFTLNKKTI